jgi:hypothetical protein
MVLRQVADPGERFSGIRPRHRAEYGDLPLGRGKQADDQREQRGLARAAAVHIQCRDTRIDCGELELLPS